MILSELINFYNPWNHDKIVGFILVYPCIRLSLRDVWITYKIDLWYLLYFCIKWTRIEDPKLMQLFEKIREKQMCTGLMLQPISDFPSLYFKDFLSALRDLLQICHLILSEFIGIN